MSSVIEHEQTHDRQGSVWEYVSPYFGPMPDGARANSIFRAYRYAADSPEIRGRLGTAEP